MEHNRFDALTRTLAIATNRRSALKGFLGLGMAAIGAASLVPDTDAARRGFAGPLDNCGCPSNLICVDGLCFPLCVGCGCACSVIPNGGPAVCVEVAYGTDGPCAGKCIDGYACNGKDICLKPCPF